jgi:hypothetical protein
VIDNDGSLTALDQRVTEVWDALHAAAETHEVAGV